MAQKLRLGDFLDEANKYIKVEFGLEKPNADIVLCSDSEWDKLNSNVYSPAFYNLKEDKIYLSSKASIADFVHEYFGHALYSEQSNLGKQLKEYLKSTSEISKQQTKDFFNKSKRVQEGFSIWIEEKILRQLGLTELWDDRSQLLAKTPYFEFYNSFLKEESEKGMITLLYKLGFPKTKEKNIIKKIAEENLQNFNNLRYLIQYGSLERDIDLLAVYSDDSVKSGLVYNGIIDINVLNESFFMQKLSLYDIEITEPVLTGNLLKGDKKAFEKIRFKLKNQEPSDAAIEYSNKRSLETFNSALFFYNQNKFKCNESLLNSNCSKDVKSKILNNHDLDFCTEDLLYALNNLSFTLSYKLSAEHYKKEKSFILFKNLLKQPILKNSVKYIKDIENGRQNLKENKVLEFITDVRSFLLENF